MTSFQETWVGKGVMHFCSCSLGMYHAQHSHDCQVLADLRLTLSRCFDQVFHRTRPFTQQYEEFQARWIGECLAQICLQSIELFFPLLFHLLPSFALYNALVHSN